MLFHDYQASDNKQSHNSPIIASTGSSLNESVVLEVTPATADDNKLQVCCCFCGTLKRVMWYFEEGGMVL